MARKARRVTSRTRTDGAGRGDSGFTLLEVVCVMAIVAAVMAIVLPAFPRGTSRTTLEAYAVKTAALLKQDHAYATSLQSEVATELDIDRRLIRSGATGSIIVLPPDVVMGAVLATRCRGTERGATIRFLPSGLSCGGTITLARLGASLQIRVNWLTGGVEIVSDSPT